jgi:hypothetical protein
MQPMTATSFGLEIDDLLLFCPVCAAMLAQLSTTAAAVPEYTFIEDPQPLTEAVFVP